MSEAELREMVKRIGKTGSLTWGSHHLEHPHTWWWKVTDAEMDEWLDDPLPNPRRDRAYALARYLLGVGEGDTDEG
jgi:hypothetical protein